jgi:hypothetical protein
LTRIEGGASPEYEGGEEQIFVLLHNFLIFFGREGGDFPETNVYFVL